MTTATAPRFLTAAETTGSRDLIVSTLLRQIGNLNVAAISGGRVLAHKRDLTGHYAAAVELPVSRGRSVQITLSALDYYTVRRLRKVTQGQHRGRFVVEHEATDVDCTQVGEAAYQAACWL